MFSAIITGLKLANWLNWIVAIVLTGFFALLLADAGGVRAEILAGRGEASREATRLYLYTVLSIVPPTAIAVHMLLTPAGRPGPRCRCGHGLHYSQRRSAAHDGLGLARYQHRGPCLRLGIDPRERG